MKKFILTAVVAATALAGMAAPALADPFHGDNNRSEQRSDQRSFRNHDGGDRGGWQHRDGRGGDRYAGYHRGQSRVCFHNERDGRRG
jgi:Ni/Co efflux regulator RcnB